MDIVIKNFDIVKDMVLRSPKPRGTWQWALILFGGVQMCRYFFRNNSVPTYGGIVSWSRVLSNIRLTRSGPEAFIRLYSKYPMVRIPTLEGWVVFVQRQYIDELARAPIDSLSVLDGTIDALQLEYTVGKRITETRDYQSAIRDNLTRHLSSIFPEMYEEMQLELDEVLKLEGHAKVQLAEWRKVQAWPTVVRLIARVSNRILVGAPLCRDPQWLNFNIYGPLEIMIICTFLNALPRWMVTFIGPMIAPAERRSRTAAKMVGPLIQERLDMDPSQWPDDFLTWLILNAPESDRTLSNIVWRLLTINFAAVHTSSLNFAHALYWAVSRTDCIGPLRAEIEEAVERMGWTKEAIGSLPKLESFMKESMRLTPFAAMNMFRKTRKPFTFSNGVTIPSGAYVAAHFHATHHDGALWDRPDEFVPFRFVEENPNGGDDAKKGAVTSQGMIHTTSTKFLPFGHGRHACPGRFFASMELKMILAYLIVNYDMKWDDELTSKANPAEQWYRPPNHWFNFTTIPNVQANLMIRRRV